MADMNDDAGVLAITVTEPSRGLFVVEVAGEMDITSTGEVRTRLEGLRGSPSFSVVVDLSSVSFIDSSGLNELVETSRTVEANNGWVIFAAAPPNVARLFEIVRLADVVPVEETVGAATMRAKSVLAHASDS